MDAAFTVVPSEIFLHDLLVLVQYWWFWWGLVLQKFVGGDVICGVVLIDIVKKGDFNFPCKEANLIKKTKRQSLPTKITNFMEQMICNLISSRMARTEYHLCLIVRDQTYTIATKGKKNKPV